MITFKPFRAFRPSASLVSKVASRPYDVLNSDEARREAAGNPYSFLRVIKPEIELSENTDPYCTEVYSKGKENFTRFIKDNVFAQDESASFYVYRLTMNGRQQTGLVGCCHYQEYFDGLIKKHELTRTVKENDRVRHVEELGANAEPVFFSYRGKEQIDSLVAGIQAVSPVYDFIADDGVRHELWLCADTITIESISELFKDVPSLYVADGHHRTAAAARVGSQRKEKNPQHDGTEEYNFFMAVLFPDDQLEIYDYNRVVKDLNGYSPDDFLKEISKVFRVESCDSVNCKPAEIRDFSLYLGGNWYRLRPLDESRSSDPVKDLDVTILSDCILGPILDITDLRKSDRIDFVGGIRGISELENRVDSGEMAAAFALYPVSMDQLLSIADAGEIMPPKTTWFEPKLRSGLFVHSID